MAQSPATTSRLVASGQRLDYRASTSPSLQEKQSPLLLFTVAVSHPQYFLYLSNRPLSRRSASCLHWRANVNQSCDIRISELTTLTSELRVPSSNGAQRQSGEGLFQSFLWWCCWHRRSTSSSWIFFPSGTHQKHLNPPQTRGNDSAEVVFFLLLSSIVSKLSEEKRH